MTSSLVEADRNGLIGVLIVFVVLGLTVGLGSSSGGHKES